MADDVRSGLVVHVLGRDEWAAAGDPLVPQSLAAEGFIHLSTAEQIAWVANQRFVGRVDLVLLVTAPAVLPRALVWEDCYETGQDFPHLYGPLPRAAVLAVLDYAPDPDGTFSPPDLRDVALPAPPRTP